MEAMDNTQDDKGYPVYEIAQISNCNDECQHPGRYCLISTAAKLSMADTEKYLSRVAVQEGASREELLTDMPEDWDGRLVMEYGEIEFSLN